MKSQKASLLIWGLVGAFCFTNCHSPSASEQNSASQNQTRSVIKNARNELSTLARGGQLIFEKDCSSCHALQVDKPEGPSLKAHTKRLDKAWTQQFLANPGQVLSYDKRVQELLHKFNYRVMPAFHYNDQQMDALWAYLEEAGN
jgi:mono/diheme cytochrome c family protein